MTKYQEFLLNQKQTIAAADYLYNRALVRVCAYLITCYMIAKIREPSFEALVFSLFRMTAW